MKQAQISRTCIKSFRKSFSGRVVEPSDPQYDQARKVWNNMIDRRPALIALCTGAADVVAALRFARENDWLVAVRGGGHSVAGYAVCDGGMVVDLSPMRKVEVDPQARTVRVEAGARWAEVDRATQPMGWRHPAARCLKRELPGSRSAAVSVI